MGKQSKIMGAVTQTVRFAIDMLKNDVVNNKNTLKLTDEQIRSLVALVESSIQTSYNRSMDQIIKEID
jgi:hypothetical protein